MAVAQLKRHTHGPAIVPKVDGPCKLCSKKIRVGIGFIAEVDHPDIGWVHYECAQSYCRLLEEHLPEDEAA
jgi:hypothetical protein